MKYRDDVYSNFIAKSRYARYLDSEKRRENWAESVTRYFDFMRKHLFDKHGYIIPQDTFEKLYSAVVNKEVLPSMRAIMTAGEALERDNTAGYNCAYIPVDDPKSFDEAMFILMCGTGVGFSVERQYIAKLPEVPDRVFDSDTCIFVHDSKEGWAKALRQLIALLYSGECPKWDVSKVRPAGARLKTFGGRASGPEPLVDLFKFVTKVFKNAQGRRLNSIECHDIMCKIGEVVVVGGVRRSAMISLSNLSDDRMRHAKAGAWWEQQGQRALANNSACYTEKPEVGVFMQEWLSLHESKSGERGIFNREAAKRVAARSGRRDSSYEFGTNPCCVVGETSILTKEGYYYISSLVGKQVEVWNGFQFSPVTPFETGIQPIYRVSLSNGEHIDCTSNHKFALDDGTIHKRIPGTDKRYRESKYILKEAILLEKGDKLAKFKMPIIEGDFIIDPEIDAYSQGFYSGDGCENNTRSYVYEPKYSCIDRLVGRILSEEKVTARRSWIHGTMLNKAFVPINASREYILSWLAGLFDADGCVTKDTNGNGLQLASVNLSFLKELRLLLTRLGCDPKVVFANDDTKKFDNYECKPAWRILINNTDTYSLLEQGMTCERLNVQLNKPQRDARRFVTVISVESLGIELPTYCFTEHSKGLGTFNGVVTGQSEIILRPNQFCNLSTIIVRAEDTVETLCEKAKLAAILGTWQSTLTEFPYLRKIWQQNTEEERLLGVSMTGPLDNHLLNNPDDPYLPVRLEAIKMAAVVQNDITAQEIGINPSTSVTCIKPEGTTSQLTDSASGLHTRHSKYYIRRIRGDVKDPLTQFMIKQGVPYEPCVMQPNTTVVFSFAKKAPEGALCREDLNATQHLKLWLLYQKHYCEHKPSVTISVKESEWPVVGAFVWDNFDYMSGVSFLPYDGGNYRQAPYEECTKEEYEELLAKCPTDMDWDSIIEDTDNVEGVQQLACTADGCEIK